MVDKDSNPKTYAIEGTRFHTTVMAPGLYVVATPIGHLADITLRALQTLAGADLIACEDTRKSRILLDRYGISNRLLAYHDHNGERARPEIVRALSDGQSVALISDAGTPLIADPGYKLVRQARDDGHAVFAIPGASALTAALSVSGLPTDRFSFHGFLPSKAKARDTLIESLRNLAGTVCFYEAPTRLALTLDALAKGLGETRPARVARELTKHYETVRSGTLRSLAQHYQEIEAPRGEIVILVGEAAPAAIDQATIDRALTDALETLRVKDAANLVAGQFALQKREVYQRALALIEAKSERDEPAN